MRVSRLNQVQTEAASRQARINQRMSNGTVGGRTSVAAPVARRTEGFRELDRGRLFRLPFSLATVSVAESGPFYPDVDMTLLAVRVALGSGTATVEARKNGTALTDVGSIAMASGDHLKVVNCLDQFTADTDALTIAATAGSGSGLVVVAFLYF